jgi:hypothetical protein
MKWVIIAAIAIPLAAGIVFYIGCLVIGAAILEQQHQGEQR